MSRGCCTPWTTTLASRSDRAGTPLARPGTRWRSWAIGCARDLAAREGIFCGISAGGTFAAALEVASRAAEGSVILAMLPDTGERYLSTVLFEGVETGSDSV